MSLLDKNPGEYFYKVRWLSLNYAMKKINKFINDLLQKSVLLHGFALASKINWGKIKNHRKMGCRQLAQNFK